MESTIESRAASKFLAINMLSPIGWEAIRRISVRLTPSPIPIAITLKS